MTFFNSAASKTRGPDRVEQPAQLGNRLQLRPACALLHEDEGFTHSHWYAKSTPLLNLAIFFFKV